MSLTDTQKSPLPAGACSWRCTPHSHCCPAGVYRACTAPRKASRPPKRPAPPLPAAQPYGQPGGSPRLFRGPPARRHPGAPRGFLHAVRHRHREDLHRDGGGVPPGGLGLRDGPLRPRGGPQGPGGGAVHLLLLPAGPAPGGGRPLRLRHRQLAGVRAPVRPGGALGGGLPRLLRDTPAGGGRR